MLNEVSRYVAKNSREIATALFQHIEISLIAMVITILIGVPLAIVLINHRRVGEIILQIAGIIQTIPSLAVLGILIPFVGIGTLPAVIALVLYAMMPVFQNSYAGLTNIDPVLLEAADALGVSRRFKLFRIQVPLAMPMILSGIRIAFVLVIGTATLAALIGGGGLGTYILLGIQTNNNAALIVGAVLAAILALLASLLIKVLSRVPFKKLVLGILIMGLLVAGVGVGRKLWTKPVETITIAGKLGAEPEILIHLYQDLIQEENPHVTVKLKRNFGGTSFLFKALQARQVDVYPEFTGTVLQSLVKQPDSISRQPKRTYQDAKKDLRAQFNMTYLAPMKYQNTYALTVRAATAKKYHLKTIADLARVGTQLNGAFDPDFYQQKDGYPGLIKAYHLTLKSVRTMEPALRYQALANGRVDVTDAYTTDPQIQQYHLVTLQDSRAFFPPYQGAPLMLTSFAKQHPKVVTALNRLAGKITATEMREMNYDVVVKHQKAATVARRYLKTHGLIK